MSKNNFWLYGEKAELARAAGLCDQQELTEFLAGRKKRFSVDTAQRLEAASLTVLGPDRKIPVAVWLRLEEHPILGVRP